MLKPKGKKEALELRWLQMATRDVEDNMYETLEAMNFEDERMLACDGYRLHIVNHPQMDDLKGLHKLNEGKPLNKTPKAYDDEIVKGDYPDIDNIIPKKENAVASVAISRHLLQEVLEMPNETGWVQIELYGKHKPVVIRDPDGEYLAVVMPIMNGIG